MSAIRIASLILICIVFEWTTSTIIIVRPQDKPQSPPPPPPPPASTPAPPPANCTSNSTDCPATNAPQQTTTSRPYQLPPFPASPGGSQKIKVDFVPLGSLLFGGG